MGTIAKQETRNHSSVEKELKRGLRDCERRMIAFGVAIPRIRLCLGYGVFPSRVVFPFGGMTKLEANLTSFNFVKLDNTDIFI